MSKTTTTAGDESLLSPGQADAVRVAREFIEAYGRTPYYREVGDLLGISESNAQGRMRGAFGKARLSDLRPLYAARALVALPEPGKRKPVPAPTVRPRTLRARGPASGDTLQDALRAALRGSSHSLIDHARALGLPGGAFTSFACGKKNLGAEREAALCRLLWPDGVTVTPRTASDAPPKPEPKPDPAPAPRPAPKPEPVSAPPALDLASIAERLASQGQHEAACALYREASRNGSAS